MMTTLSLQIVGIIEPIIQHADWFFPGGGDLMICMYCNPVVGLGTIYISHHPSPVVTELWDVKDLHFVGLQAAKTTGTHSNRV